MFLNAKKKNIVEREREKEREKEKDGGVSCRFVSKLDV